MATPYESVILSDDDQDDSMPNYSQSSQSQSQSQPFDDLDSFPPEDTAGHTSNPHQEQSKSLNTSFNSQESHDDSVLVQRAVTLCDQCGETRSRNMAHVCARPPRQITQRGSGRKKILAQNSDGHYMCSNCEYTSEKYQNVYQHCKARGHNIQRVGESRDCAKVVSGQLHVEDVVLNFDNNRGSDAVNGRKASTANVHVENQDPQLQHRSAESHHNSQGSVDPDDHDDDDNWDPYASEPQKDKSLEPPPMKKAKVAVAKKRGRPRKKPQNPAQSFPQNQPKQLPNGKFMCCYCDKIINKRDDAIVHQYKHFGFKPFQCSVCKKRFRLRFKHKNKCHGPPADGAEVGGDVSAEESEEDTETEADIDEPDPSTNRNHEQSSCLPARSVPTRKTGDQTYGPNCVKVPEDGDCPRPTKNADGLFECHFCDYTTKYYSACQLHQWQHTGYKPFKCRLCHKNFLNTTQARKHVKCHAYNRKRPQLLPITKRIKKEPGTPARPGRSPAAGSVMSSTNTSAATNTPSPTTVNFIAPPATPLNSTVNIPSASTNSIPSQAYVANNIPPVPPMVENPSSMAIVIAPPVNSTNSAMNSPRPVHPPKNIALDIISPSRTKDTTVPVSETLSIYERLLGDNNLPGSMMSSSSTLAANVSQSQDFPPPSLSVTPGSSSNQDTGIQDAFACLSQIKEDADPRQQLGLQAPAVANDSIGEDGMLLSGYGMTMASALPPNQQALANNQHALANNQHALANNQHALDNSQLVNSQPFIDNSQQTVHTTQQTLYNLQQTGLPANTASLSSFGSIPAANHRPVDNLTQQGPLMSDASTVTCADAGLEMTPPQPGALGTNNNSAVSNTGTSGGFSVPPYTPVMIRDTAASSTSIPRPAMKTTASVQTEPETRDVGTDPAPALSPNEDTASTSHQTDQSLISPDHQPVATNIKNLYKCNLCSIFFADKYMYESHIELHCAYKVGRCSKCTRHFASPLAFLTHLKCSTRGARAQSAADVAEQSQGASMSAGKNVGRGETSLGRQAPMNPQRPPHLSGSAMNDLSPGMPGRSKPMAIEGITPIQNQPPGPRPQAPGSRHQAPEHRPQAVGPRPQAPGSRFQNSPAAPQRNIARRGRPPLSARHRETHGPSQNAATSVSPSYPNPQMRPWGQDLQRPSLDSRSHISPTGRGSNHSHPRAPFNNTTRPPRPNMGPYISQGRGGPRNQGLRSSGRGAPLRMPASSPVTPQRTPRPQLSPIDASLPHTDIIRLPLRPGLPGQNTARGLGPKQHRFSTPSPLRPQQPPLPSGRPMMNQQQPPRQASPAMPQAAPQPPPLPPSQQPGSDGFDPTNAIVID